MAQNEKNARKMLADYVQKVIFANFSKTPNKIHVEEIVTLIQSSGGMVCSAAILNKERSDWSAVQVSGHISSNASY
jgi:hypothetical protein